MAFRGRSWAGLGSGRGMSMDTGRIRAWRWFGALVAIAFLHGCAVTTATRNAAVDDLLITGDYIAAAELAEARLGYPPVAGGDRSPVVVRNGSVLDHLEAAEAWRLSGDPVRAIAHFDAAESSLRAIEDVGVGVISARQTGAVLLGDGSLPYLPSPSEAVLINYYKAIAFLQMGDPGNARVELNRSEDRTRRAAERYKSEIEDAASEASGKGVETVKTNSLVSEHFPEMQHWESYETFILPSAVYLQALFLGVTGSGSDIESARNLMQRVAAITRNPVALEDYERLEQGSLCPDARCVWVIAEHGFGPELVERRFDLPVPTSKGVVLLSMAMPALNTRTQVIDPPFTLFQAGEQVGFSTLGSMDQVVQTEFEKRFPGMVIRSTAGAIVKAVAQEEAYKQGGLMGGLLANILTIATTNADIRMWRSMPGVFSVARLELQAGELVLLRSAHGEQSVQLDGEGPMIVHIKQVDPATPPVVTVLSAVAGQRT